LRSGVFFIAAPCILEIYMYATLYCNIVFRSYAFVYFDFSYSQLSGVENLPFFFKFGLDLAESL